MTADSAGLKLTENILTPSGSIVASQRFDNNGNGTGWYSYNYDIRQSTTAIVNSAGVLQNNYQYEAFGQTTESGSLLNEVEFTGAISDNNTGLYYMNARYYNPNTGRFISQDSYKGSAYEPWTQNLYTYTGNNPVNYTDPTEHFFGPLFSRLMGGDTAGEKWGAAIGAVVTLALVTTVIIATGGIAMAPLLAIGIGAGTGLVAGVAGEIVGEVAEAVIDNDEMEWNKDEMFIAGGFGLVGGAFGGGVAAAGASRLAQVFVNALVVDTVTDLSVSTTQLVVEQVKTNSNNLPESNDTTSTSTATIVASSTTKITTTQSTTTTSSSSSVKYGGTYRLERIYKGYNKPIMLAQ